MNIVFKTKSLLAVALLVSFNSFAAENVEDNKSFAPEATAAQSKLSFKDIPYLKEAFVDAAPTDRKDGLVLGKLGADGGNKEMIVKVSHEIADSQHDKIDSLLIAHKGKLLFESYYSRGRINLPHFQASATKVYTSLALGRAIQLGYLTMADLDKPLVSFLKDLDPSKFVEGVEKITLHQAMTMRSGIRISKEQKEELESNPSQLIGQGEVQAYLENSSAITAESQRFLYQNDPMLVMQVLDALVPGTVKDFIKNELLDKVGITTYSWGTDVSGLPKSGSGSNMTSRDMVKWGLLTINKGKWNGEQLIPEAFITKAINRIVRHSDDENFSDDGIITNTGYGYFWWQADMKYSNKNYFSTSARGGGGQYIILIEELDLVIVVTAHDRDDNILKIVAERILPAFVQDKLSVLKGPYVGQKPPDLIPEVFAPGIVSINGRHEGVVTFSPDLDEIYFGANNDDETHINFSRLEGGKWTPIKKADFTNGKIDEEIHPFVSLDGKRIYFTAISSDLSYNKIWYVNRLKNGWSGAIELESPVNDDQVFYPNQSADGDLYYFNLSKRRTYYASNNLNGFSQIEPVEIEFGVHAFIAASQDYLVLNARNKENENRNDNDIYVSFKRENGTWTKPINLGDEVNSKLDDRAPTISPDGKYLFFGRDEEEGEGEANIHWVSTKVIENLRPETQSKEQGQ